MRSVVGEKGQVTIPKPLRDSLGIRPGVELEFEEEGGKLVATQIVARDPLEALVGLVPKANVDRELERLRGPAWRADLDGDA